MVRKVMVDVGLNRTRSCTGAVVGESRSPAFRIGEELCEQLEQMGFETLFSGNVPELAEREESAGRPAACAAIAARWRADCVVRLCIRAAETPNDGSANAMVYRRPSGSWQLADSILRSVEDGSELRAGDIRQTTGVVLLRRTPCPSVILILRLPFRQKEHLTDDEVSEYGLSIAKGIYEWAQTVGKGKNTYRCYSPRSI